MALSIIIPVLNEEKLLPALLSYLNKYITPEDEIIMVDAGSHDHTVTIGQKYNSKIVFSHVSNRAAQMNLGAKEAQNETLYFLHADAVPPKDLKN